jgi:hypothetical protein
MAPHSIVYAPFTDDQVRQCNDYQLSGIFHPFTCGRTHEDDVAGEDHILRLTPRGWVCPDKDCGYEQDWAWEWQVDGTWREFAANTDFTLRVKDDMSRIVEKEWVTIGVIIAIIAALLLTIGGFL